MKKHKKPIVFLDTDGVLNTWDSEGKTHPTFKKALCRVPGAQEFMEWVTKHCDVRWLTEWFHSGKILFPEDLDALSWLLRVPRGLLEPIPAVKWRDFKTEGIEEVIAREPDREWFWLDDDRIQREQSWLDTHGHRERFIHVDCFEDKHALRKAHQLLTELVRK